MKSLIVKLGRVGNAFLPTIAQFLRVSSAFLPTDASIKGGHTIKQFAHPTQLIKSIPQVQDERDQHTAVRPEPVEALKRFRWQIVITLLLVIGLQAPASAMMDHDHMLMDDKGMIMNANTDRLPKDCPKISKDVDITIRAGHKYAQKFTGKMFAFDNQSWDVPACARVNITFINDDDIRHQLMIHGLPGYLYPQGMLHLELYGAGELKASLIMPSMKKTYLVHCELPQHMEKGMKAQLKVDGGDGDLPSIPGLTKPLRADSYPVDWTPAMGVMLLICVLVGCLVPILLVRKFGSQE